MPEPAQPQRDAPATASVLSVFLLAFAFVAGSFAQLLPIVYQLMPAVDLGPPLPVQHQPAENLLYLLGFFLILPVSIWLSARLADRISSGPEAERLPWMAGVLLGGLLLVAGLTRLSVRLPWGGGLNTLLVLAVLWAGFATVLLSLAIRGRGIPGLEWLSRRPEIAAALGVLLVAVAVLSLSNLSHIDLRALIVGLAVAAVGTWLFGRHRLRHIGRPWGILVDLVVFGLVLLAVPDMVIYRIVEFAATPDDAYGAYIQQFHGALFIGAASQILAGGTLLVDTVSQYGVASIYLLAGVFKVLPIGYGTLSITDGMLSGLVFACGYSILRMTGVNRLLAASSIAFAVVVLIYGTTYPIGGLLQHGAIRFGLLPVLLITMRLASLCWPAASRFTGIASWLIVGLSAIWALEAFIYVTATFAGLTLVSSSWQPRDRRIRWFACQFGKAALAWITAHLLFAAATLLASGELPDWGLYFTYVRDFLSGDVGDLTYDFLSFSPGLLVAAGYVAASILLLANLWRNAAWADRNRLPMLALGGLTAYGVALFSYFDNRSLEHVLPYVSLPLLLASVIWLDLLLRDTGNFSRRVRTFSLAGALAIAALCVSVVWPAAGKRATDSVLAYAVPGGPSLKGGFERLGDLPPVVAGADEGQRLVDRYMPDEDRTAIITVPDLDVNILVLTQRSNRLGITDAKEASWVPGPHEPIVDRAVDELAAGDRMLVDQPALNAFEQLQLDPSIDREELTLDTGIAAIQLRILARIGERFELEPVAEGAGGLTVVSLEPRRP